ncbi:class I SAM-dependent methyltransferase [Natronolimnohabitans sp. A-GB9]|uniref:class I SAM-dependent methyltransferase n=1 Tax=Natronolimnohabitans sp. A-GB9 TaxID=3069757 RepID=UPI0027B57907|nr:class I SAM-dependent methyltransferase [Natronolimnohabitans sp. A-GB9]MDQ2051583.1 class I SAM-dependent methyltransferase [Natronolimnohabitans sp. A-GB9]
MDSNDVRRQWADRSGEFSPAYYAYYGPDETSDVLRGTFEQHLERDASVLELGCSSGRHLSHLYDAGFEALSGIELNDDAIDVMEDVYPALAAEGEFYLTAIEDIVADFEDDQFDAVYSVETLQHLHPDAEWVFDELARITGEVLVTAEIEGDAGSEDADDHTSSSEPNVNYVNDDFPLYHRDWSAVFTDRGFVEVDVQSTKRDTIRTFRPTASRTDR